MPPEFPPDAPAEEKTLCGLPIVRKAIETGSRAWWRRQSQPENWHQIVNGNNLLDASVVAANAAIDYACDAESFKWLAELSAEQSHPPLELPEVLVRDLDVAHYEGLSKYVMTGTTGTEQNPDLNTILGELTAETTETGFSVPGVSETEASSSETEASSSETEEPLPAVLTVNDEPRDPLLDALPVHPRPVIGSFWATEGRTGMDAVVEVLELFEDPCFIKVRVHLPQGGTVINDAWPAVDFTQLVRIANWQGFGAEPAPVDVFAPKVDQRTALFDIESRAESIASELQCRPAHVAVMVDTVLQTVEQLCTLRSVSQSSPVFAALRGLLASQPGQMFSDGIALALDGPLRSIVHLEVDRIAQQFAADVEESKKLYAQAYFGVKSKQDDGSFDSKEANPQLSETFADFNSTLLELREEIGRLDSRMDDIERARIAGENRKAKRYADAGKARRVPKAEALAGRRARDKTLRESKAREALDDIGLSEQPVKRGRGRPPKSAGGPAAKPAKAPPAAVKRGRGRPPKSGGGPAAKPAKAPPAAVKRGRGRPPKSAQVGDVPRSFSSVDLMNKIQKFIGKANPKVQHLMSRIPAAHLSKFLSAASRGMPALDVMKLTTWTPSEQGAFAAWYFSDGAASR
jgi:hypothetical protein